MAKTKTPFFSFEAHGTLGKTLTAQKRGAGTMLRMKPSPVDPLTLAQQYQRWDYTDQAYTWHSLTATQKATYETLARPLHMTGFAYWMRTRLKTLPDITARWHLDTIIAGKTPDSSKNANHGTVYGAYPLTGIIDKGLFFDGLDDYINLGRVQAFETPPWTIELWFKLYAYGTAVPEKYPTLFFKVTPWSSGVWLYWHQNQSVLRVRFFGVGGVASAFSPTALNTWYHVVIVLDSDKRSAHTYVDGINKSNPVLTADFIPSTTNLLINGYDKRFKGLIDEVPIYNRALSAPEILTHSKRRYPP